MKTRIAGNEPLVPNGLQRERLAIGVTSMREFARRARIEPAIYSRIEGGELLPTAQELDRIAAALRGVPLNRLYVDNYLTVIGALEPSREREYANYSQRITDTAHMLVGRDELTWMDRPRHPDRRADVFVNLSCSTQAMPHLLLDTVAVLRALGVDFVAAAGSTACCGKPFRRRGQQDRGERVSLANLDRSIAWGARVHINWCTACQITSTTAAARRFLVDQVTHPVREIQLFTFVAEWLQQLGNKAPWARTVTRRVLVEGHPDASPVHRDARQAAANVLALVPGVTVVDLYEAPTSESPCAIRSPVDGAPATAARWPATPDGVQAQRQWLAEHTRSLGADTISCMHQYCHQLWSRVASDGLAVRHPISVLAEALGCAHPDRYQAAVRLGNPDLFAEQTRPLWQSWGITEERAHELAARLSDPMFADYIDRCRCGRGVDCSESFVPVQVPHDSN